ncbi:hypothetical protein ACFSQJ_18975 [Croceitalea marina]|uniref:Lipocalin-like domain-containing protein n=1 Tax=Croceitalea marina TaxID=1775166 RepID=A0ABW5N1M6_9FLAO
MKKIFLKLLVVFTLISGISCDETKDQTGNFSAEQITELKSIAVEGTWEIAYFFDTDKEETSNFNGFSFTFNASGALLAVNGTNEINGTWSITDSSSDDDSNSESDVDFNIFFSTPLDFEELSDDWDIVSYTSSRIELKDVSGGNGGIDNLVFEKKK